jgi:uncharacterized protein DUF4242
MCAPAPPHSVVLTMRMKEGYVEQYVIFRRGGWGSAAELGRAGARSKQVVDEEMSDEVQWVRSYVLDEGGASVGMVCIYEATGPEAIRRHAARAGMPIEEIIRVVDTVVMRADPEPAAV